MATRFTEEATAQLAPVYDQQSQAISSQVPAIQNLYQTLIQGLQQQGQQQLTAGVAGINEDASRRGILRSSLPTDARQSLQGQISQALLQSQGQLGAQQAGDIANVNEKLGTLGVQRAGAITDLSRSLETRDLEERQFQFNIQQAKEQAERQRIQDEFNRQQAERSYQIEQQKLEQQKIATAKSSAPSAKAPTQAQSTQMAASALARELKGVAGRDGYVSPQDYAAGRREWVGAGFSSKTYDDYFSGYKNPQNNNYQYF